MGFHTPSARLPRTQRNGNSSGCTVPTTPLLATGSLPRRQHMLFLPTTTACAGPVRQRLCQFSSTRPAAGQCQRNAELVGTPLLSFQWPVPLELSSPVVKPRSTVQGRRTFSTQLLLLHDFRALQCQRIPYSQLLFLRCSHVAQHTFYCAPSALLHSVEDR